MSISGRSSQHRTAHTAVSRRHVSISGMTRALSTRILVKVLLAHAVLLPVLAICLGLIVQRSHVELFVDFVHDTLARRTSELQTGRADTHDAGLLQFLDTAVLDG